LSQVKLFSSITLKPIYSY